ncbi:TIGR04104 family putative zinc finger protein [Lentibacillus saliphilus]|uniref:TIGR04104 family putative zinc finger protein n=1 Tax=Lentibacillus saliphilus TaxID=2737028 RepID=UPI001C304646|nr:TIGR04104 family putative zinc finger protein [Lentibacillus saliphilus]
MPTCQQCGKRWTWKQTMRASFTLDTGYMCPYCETKQYLTKKARHKTSATVFVIPISLLLPVFFDMQWYVLVPIYLSVGVLIFLIQPFLMDLSNDEEPLW